MSCKHPKCGSGRARVVLYHPHTPAAAACSLVSSTAKPMMSSLVGCPTHQRDVTTLEADTGLRWSIARLSSRTWLLRYNCESRWCKYIYPGPIPGFSHGSAALSLPGVTPHPSEPMPTQASTVHWRAISQELERLWRRQLTRALLREPPPRAMHRTRRVALIVRIRLRVFAR